MDATCAIQNSIHVFSLVHINMCPGFWVHITSLRQHHFSGQRIIFSLSTSTNSFKRPRPDIWTEFFISCRLMTVDGRFRAVWGGK